MSYPMLSYLMENLLLIMQVSIVVPMLVVWRRRQHFSPPIKLLSWYVYLSIAGTVGARLGAAYLHNNLLFLTGFNLGKIILFAAVYAKVLLSNRLRQVLLLVTWATVIAASSILGYDWKLAVSVSRVAQCALLAGFALVYLEQRLNQPVERPFMQDPLWLLSVGQLLYSAGTATAFSLQVFRGGFVSDLVACCLSLAGLTLNYFLTLAFLRARPDNAPLAAPAQATSHWVTS